MSLARLIIIIVPYEINFNVQISGISLWYFYLNLFLSLNETTLRLVF